MPRIRTIKPEFWSSPSMCGANPWARLLYIAMWNWADDTGRGTANVRELHAFAFPDDEDPVAPTVAELPSLLKEVRGRWGVIFYRVGGRRYYAIPTWDEHQRTERRAQSRYPGPEEGEEYDPGPPDQGKRPARDRHKEVPPHSGGTSARPDGSSGPGTGEQGNRGTGERSGAGWSGPLTSASAPDRQPSVAAAKAVGLFVPPGISRRDREALARHCDTGITDGATWTAIEHALIDWSRRSDVSPGFLPSLITNAVKAEHGATTSRGRSSTTDDRVQAGLTLADELRAEAALADYQPPHPLRIIEGGTG